MRAATLFATIVSKHNESPYRLKPEQEARRRIFICAAVALISFSLLACASTPPDRIAYNSIDGATTAVQTAVGVFKQMKAAGQIQDVDGSKEAQVRDAYAKFQKTALLAVDLSQDITQGQNALKIVSDAAVSALAVINAFTQKKAA